MSQERIAVLEADGKHYKLVFNREMQAEYKRLINEKKQDSKYQKTVAEYARLKNEYEEIHESYVKCKSEYLKKPTDKDLKEAYLELKVADKEAFDEYNEYASNHTDGDTNDYSMYVLGQITLLGLQTQYKLDEKQALEVWNKFVEEKGQIGSMVWLGGLADTFFAHIDEETENPTMKRMLLKAEEADNRRAGLNKIKK